MLGSIGGYLVDGVAEFVRIDVHDQLFVGVLHDVTGVRIPVFHPALHALRLEEFGQVAGLADDFHHPCLQTGEVEDIVNEVQQVVGVVEDALAECRFAGYGRVGVDLFYVFEHGVHRCADLLYHVLHETVFRVLHFLHLGRLDVQLPLDVTQFAEVAQQTEVLHHAAFLVVQGHQIELHLQLLAALDAEGGADVRLDVLVDAFVHIVEHTHGEFLRGIIDECHAACLGHGVLYLVDAAVDGQRMGGRRVGGQAHVTLVEHAVDVGVVLSEHSLHGIEACLLFGVLFDTID